MFMLSWAKWILAAKNLLHRCEKSISRVRKCSIWKVRVPAFRGKEVKRQNGRRKSWLNWVTLILWWWPWGFAWMTTCLPVFCAHLQGQVWWSTRLLAEMHTGNIWLGVWWEVCKWLKALQGDTAQCTWSVVLKLYASLVGHKATREKINSES